MKKTVCALVVTYNRKEYLINCLNALINQSYKPTTIIIFDNNSSDGTNIFLMNNGIIKNDEIGLENYSVYKGINIIYYRNSDNLGGSYGFHKGIYLAHKTNCDYIWTMDDDVLPETDCLEVLITELINKRVCIPNRTDENYTDKAIIGLNMSNPIKYTINSRKTTLDPRIINKDAIRVVDMPFEGPIFERSIVDEIGLPNKDLFIIFDDSEYAYRISKVTDIYFVTKAILHKQIVPTKSKNRIMNWKSYYGYRNQYWFDRKYGKNVFVKIFRPVLNHIDLTIRSLIRLKWNNIKILKAAYYDGTHNIIGKTVEPGKDFIWRKNK